MKFQNYKAGILLVVVGLFSASSFATTVDDIKSAILGTQSFTESELEAMDLNGDARVDVADLIAAANTVVIPPALMVGNYVGVMQSDFEDLLANVGDSSGALPLSINVSEVSPATASIENNADSFSLYFPEGSLPLTISTSGTNVQMTLQLETADTLLSATPIQRSLTFDGDLTDIDGMILLSGTYTENLIGLSDVLEDALTVSRTGTFILFFSEQQ